VCSAELGEVLADLDRYREEQNQLERQQQELVGKIRQRKAEFKELWGVSPMSINRIRTARRPPVLTDLTNISAARGAGVDASSDMEEQEVENNEENVCPLDDLRRVRFNSGHNQEKLLSPALSSGQVLFEIFMNYTDGVNKIKP